MHDLLWARKKEVSTIFLPIGKNDQEERTG
jgi:hypothetical protein